MAQKEKPTTKTCKYCGTEIPYAAKVCPNCRKKLKGGIFGKIIIGVIALAVLGALFGNDNSESNTSKTKKVGEVGTTQSAEKAESIETTAPQKADYHVGDILMDDEMKIVFMSSGEYVSNNEFIQPTEGNKFIFIRLAFENTSAKNDKSVSMYSFKCYADGYSAEQRFFDDDALSARLSAGRTTSGMLVFEVPENAKEIDIEYETNVFTNEKIHFIYEGVLDSGYVPQLNTNATEGAYSVGDVIESSKLKITYLGCEDYKSENMFVQAKEGYHFISCILEFENLGNSDEHISSMSFDCYADGVDCDQTFIRDDDLSATLSAGRKCKGSVTFEVPNDAVVVEVEFISNYWTSNRVVFTVK